MTQKIVLYDTTLRDGTQAEDVNLSTPDKIKIALRLDEFGIDYIEGGWPGSNPVDVAFFKEIANYHLKYARIAAFGSTHHPDNKAEDDPNLNALIASGATAGTIFGKSCERHAKEALRLDPKRNLDIIRNSVAYLKRSMPEVYFDAEHFFDGYAWNPSYALASLEAAQRGGADCICLCETNGGAFPDQVAQVTAEAVRRLKVPVGIHTHNDGGMAVANSIVAVQAGASWVQGTLIGFGERCGNANLSTVIANLQLKRGYTCIPAENLEKLTRTCRAVSEVSNVALAENMPYVGKSAFAHKGGMHIDGVNKASSSFEHINPESVGNSRRFLISEVAGRSTLLERIRKIDPTVQRDDEITEKIIWHLKQLEHQGYQFEGAEATLEMLIRRQLGRYRPHFAVRKFKTIGEQQAGEETASATALVKVEVGGQEEINAAEGDGPVNALDCALRKALERFFPILRTVHLTDYKVRVLDSRERTASKVRVLIESTDGQESWTTVGVSVDIIEASLNALIDAIEYKLVHSSGREW